MNAIKTPLMDALRQSLDRLIQGICPTEEYVLVDKRLKACYLEELDTVFS